MSLLFQEQVAGPPQIRIELSDLTPFSDAVLKAARTMNLMFQETEGNISMPFWKAVNARRIQSGLTRLTVLTGAEREFITEYVDRKVSKVDNIVTIVDYMLQTPDACMLEAGIKFEKDTAPKKMIQPVLPVDDTGKIGGQMVAGLLVAAFVRENKTSKPTEITVLDGYGIPDFTSTNMAKFQTSVLPDMKLYFSGKESKGKGRPYISEIFAYLKSLPCMEYYAIQCSITRTLLSGCFNWKHRKEEKGKKPQIYKTPVKGSFPFIDSVKEEYQSSFFLLTQEYEGVEEFQKAAGVHGPFYVWCKGLPTRSEVVHDPIESFAAAHKHLQLSRTFRGTDESGLSAWTSSFLACPGYTKDHLSMCRLLSLVLGCAKTGSVYVHGTSEDFRLRICSNLELRKVSNVRFVVDKNSLSTSLYAAMYVLAEPSKTKKSPQRTSIFVVSAPADSAKEDDWKKVDGNAEKRIGQYFPQSCGRVAILTHVQSDIWFKHGFHIGSPTSLHSMYSVVANFKVTYAGSDGFGAPLQYFEMTDRTRDSFLQCVLAHNLDRNLAFLFPSYHCNPRMNLLMRPVKPKLAFKKMKVAMEGSEVHYDPVSKGSVPMENDYEEDPDSEDEDEDEVQAEAEPDSEPRGDEGEADEEEGQGEEDVDYDSLFSEDVPRLPRMEERVRRRDANNSNSSVTSVAAKPPVVVKEVKQVVSVVKKAVPDMNAF